MTRLIVQQHDPTASQASISEWLRSAHSLRNDQHLYALLDGAQLNGLPRDLNRLASHRHSSLFRHLGKRHVEADGPCCLSLGMTADDPALAYTCQAAMNTYGVIWLISELPLRDVVPLLASRMDAKLERGPYVHFRYYDPRTFTELARLLNPSQSSFLSFAACWLWIDHAGNCRSLELNQDMKAAKEFEPPLILDQEQEKGFLQASLPYEVMSVLEENAPHLLEPIPRMKRHSILKAGVDQAQAEGKYRLTELAAACLAKLRDTCESIGERVS